jgi:hypothetical protein
LFEIFVFLNAMQSKINFFHVRKNSKKTAKRGYSAVEKAKMRTLKSADSDVILHEGHLTLDAAFRKKT